MINPYYFQWDGKKQGYEAFTTEWINYMSQHIVKAFRPHSSNEQDKEKNTTTIVVHIRRGVEPCDLLVYPR